MESQTVVVHGKVNPNCIKQPGHSNPIEEFGPELGVCFTCRSGQTKDRDTHAQLHATNHGMGGPQTVAKLLKRQPKMEDHKATLNTNHACTLLLAAYPVWGRNLYIYI
jgi:hypothetical protein